MRSTPQRRGLLCFAVWVLTAVMLSAAVAEPLRLEVAKAELLPDRLTNDTIIVLTLTAASASLFSRFTAENVGRKTALSIDGRIVLTPVIREPIMGGRLQITSASMLGDAREVVNRLSAGIARLSVDLAAD